MAWSVARRAALDAAVRRPAGGVAHELAREAHNVICAPGTEFWRGAFQLGICVTNTLNASTLLAVGSQAGGGGGGAARRVAVLHAFVRPRWAWRVKPGLDVGTVEATAELRLAGPNDTLLEDFLKWSTLDQFIPMMEGITRGAFEPNVTTLLIDQWKTDGKPLPPAWPDPAQSETFLSEFICSTPLVRATEVDPSRPWGEKGTLDELRKQLLFL
eukprot:TRINITY_DN1731_c0_g1_i1.p1 TRINITY_DN1731_c0_g1~~TRINITY_DN1731_c0_g1_i1.p1  ORF type:complete len:233 (+),score=46.11 TRINITY_DN1731_c0_g1_i1:58-699(+)